MSWPYQGKGYFDSGLIDLGGYFKAQLSGVMTVQINDTLDEVKVIVDFDSNAKIANGDGSGGGFYNLVSVGWVNDNQLYTSLYAGTGYEYFIVDSQNPDYESRAKSNMDSFLNDQFGSSFATNIITYVWDRDDDPDDRYFGRWSWAADDGRGIESVKHFEHTFTVNPSEIIDQQTGRINTLYPLYIAVRWYNWENRQPEKWQAWCSFDHINGFSNIVIQWDYFPWAVKSGNSWLSCNRENMSYKVKRSSNSWAHVEHEAKNNEDTTLAQHGFIRTNGSWVRQVITGEE